MKFLKLTLFCAFLLAGSMKADSQTAPTTKDSIINQKELAGKDNIYEDNNVEIRSAFPGGERTWKAYLHSNLVMEVPATNGAPAGAYEVVLKFTVWKDGKISDIKAETQQGYGMEKEATRVLKKGPKWVPAQLNGQFVNSYRKISFEYSVAEQ